MRGIFETIFDTGLCGVFMEKQAIVDLCQNILNYEFKDVSLLHKALTHASVASTRQDSNERLEFLGDAVLGMCICSALYEAHDDMLEGEMTKIKSTVVSRKTCALIVRELKLEELLFLSGDMANPAMIPESICAGLLESLIGAIYIDGGYEPATEFIMRVMQPFIDEALGNSHQQNFKSVLQQHAQKLSSATPEYVLLDEQGPDHSKCFEIAIRMEGRDFPSAWGRSKKEAEQAAAKRALQELGLLAEEPDEFDGYDEVGQDE